MVKVDTRQRKEGSVFPAARRKCGIMSYGTAARTALTELPCVHTALNARTAGGGGLEQGIRDVFLGR